MSRKNNKKVIKAFFESSIKDDNKNLKIISLLNKHNCNVMQTVIGTDLNYPSGSTGDKASVNIFGDKIKDIVDSNVFICEISDITPSLLSLIFEGINRKKPVLALYKKGTLPNEEWLSEKYPLLKLKEYEEGDLEEIISEFLDFAHRKLLTSRFTIRLNEELCDYTDYLKSRFGCSSRNEVILKLLDDMREEDHNFQEIEKQNYE